MPKYVYLLIPLTVIGIYAMYKKSLTDLVKSFEGFSAKVYRDSAGLLTIGYGHLIKAGENFSVISEAQATEILYRDLTTAKNAVIRLVKVPLKTNQFDALVSLVFNIGEGAFESSTLLRKLNMGDYTGASAEFPRWNKAGGAIVQGLVNRRAKERALFDGK